ncbi:UDP-glucose dehydrogenase family protein [Thiocapsa rosea]|uniref:UDP-glucose 6-dehydrogenase n=1 Tax=Thiocapsa rosea TaxID=69360 RepID=A0A495VDN2_9GAMM|nr:UDP-glucose/GDP-mannose dehydrogenase family protein [Thiocapsa rosea]RKT47472.1 UDPglucose 6-dehydrogenase/GDP-mannose 6-dehydrogenase [Thiocapsa rosea]
MNVSVVGTGYVGLVSAVCLAEKGHQVICVDVDEAKVDQINQGISPIYEDGLDSLLEKNVGVRVLATTDLRRAVLDSDLSLIAVGTPFDGNEIDLKYVRIVSEQVGLILKEKSSYHVVVMKSTVVPGTTEEVMVPILEKASGKLVGRDFGVGMNPEFLREGEAIQDFLYPDRIVLGGVDKRSVDALAALYEGFPGVDLIRTNTKTAEMIKYSSNSLLATLISFSNEIGNLCAKVGVDVVDAMHGVHLDRRLSPILATGERVYPSSLTYLAAGCGFGGSCFPKDVKALIAYGKQVGSPMELLQAVIDINSAQPQRMLDLVKEQYPNLDGVKVAVLGMAFKPGTDDIRESPSLPVTDILVSEGALVSAFDPIARHEAEGRFGSAVRFSDDLEGAIEGADAILVMTRWKQFERLPELVAGMAKAPLVVDGRRMLAKDSVPRYRGIGLAPDASLSVIDR